MIFTLTKIVGIETSEKKTIISFWTTIRTIFVVNISGNYSGCRKKWNGGSSFNFKRGASYKIFLSESPFWGGVETKFFQFSSKMIADKKTNFGRNVVLMKWHYINIFPVFQMFYKGAIWGTPFAYFSFLFRSNVILLIFIIINFYLY